MNLKSTLASISSVLCLSAALGCSSSHTAPDKSPKPDEAGSEATPQVAQPVGTQAPEQVVPPFHHPVPDGWIAETFPFPLWMAPKLKQRGIWHQVAAPGVSEPDHPNQGTLMHVWWMEPQEAPRTAEDLVRDLTTYTNQVAAFRRPGNRDSFDVELREVLAVAGRRHFEGTAVRSNQRRRHLRAQLLECEEQGRSVAIVLSSAQPYDAPIWNTLTEMASGFRCSKPPAEQTPGQQP